VSVKHVNRRHGCDVLEATAANLQFAKASWEKLRLVDWLQALE
jgi:hypothetical protein